ncbi:MAG: 3-oxoacyl-ACP synthase III family protein [Kiritimatiellia bacterium]|jgi:3-oxoacyl-[acyl-carrier-protein] synthase-3
MTNSRIVNIAVYLPEIRLPNSTLAEIYPGWTAEKIFEKTGIRERRVCAESETAGDLAELAAKKLLAGHGVDPTTVDFIILVTQSPDYFLPTTACMLQHRLGLPTHAGALDVNLGCSGFIYGLSLCKGLIAAEIARNVLLVTAETYTKHIHPMDKSVRTIFGDGAAATLVSAAATEGIGNFVLGTDGSGYDKLIVPAGGMRLKPSETTALEYTDESGNTRSQDNVFMDGAEIFSFTISTVPQTVKETLAKNGVTLEEVDLFVFHQANKYMLDFLRKKCKIPEEKFYMNFEDCGNTVCASIPIALAHARADRVLRPGMKVMLVGFGVGLSWGAVIVNV